MHNRGRVPIHRDEAHGFLHTTLMNHRSWLQEVSTVADGCGASCNQSASWQEVSTTSRQRVGAEPHAIRVRRGKKSVPLRVSGWVRSRAVTLHSVNRQTL